jgi:hypothetical protein
MNAIPIPKPDEYGAYYQGYMNMAKGKDVVKALSEQVQEVRNYFKDKNEAQSEKAYAPGKWTPKELLGHIIDTDRIMAFRALCICRGEQAALPGFDQDSYMAAVNFNKIPLEDLLDDFELERKSLLSMIRLLPEAAFYRKGIANDTTISVSALLHIIVGHTAHHLQILNDRY